LHAQSLHVEVEPIAYTFLSHGFNGFDVCGCFNSLTEQYFLTFV